MVYATTRVASSGCRCTLSTVPVYVPCLGIDGAAVDVAAPLDAVTHRDLLAHGRGYRPRRGSFRPVGSKSVRSGGKPYRT